MKREKQQLDMTQGSPAKLLVKFAIPMLLGAVFDLLYNMVDAIVLGKFVSADALAAVGATTAVTGMIIMLGFAFTQSISILIAQAFGAGGAQYGFGVDALVHGHAPFLGKADRAMSTWEGR